MIQEVTNFARFYGILKASYKFATKELGDEFKEGVVSQFTNGRTTSLREMTRREYDTMCDKLEGATAHLLRTVKDEQRRQRSKCLRLMQKVGIAYRELQGDQYIEFLECIEYEIDKELEEGDWSEPEDDE